MLRKSLLVVLASIALAGEVTIQACDSAEDCTVFPGLIASCVNKRCVNSFAQLDELCGASTPNFVDCEGTLRCVVKGKQYVCQSF